MIVTCRLALTERLKMGKEWRKSSDGPDWIDVMMTLNAIEKLHECRAGLTVIPATQGHNGGAKCEVWAQFAVLPTSTLPARVSVEFTWPSGKGLGMVGAFYRAALELDYKLGGQYVQRALDEIA